jgi:translation initiation factor 2 subunit 2
MAATRHRKDKELKLDTSPLPLDLSKKKKRRKKVQATPDEDDMPYHALLTRAYHMMDLADVHPERRPERVKVPPPQVTRAGPRTLWHNFGATVAALGRKPDHVARFLTDEMKIKHWSLKNQDAVLAVRARLRPEQFVSLLHRYVLTYVACAECGSHHTLLVRDANTRLTSLACEACQARRVVPVA